MDDNAAKDNNTTEQRKWWITVLLSTFLGPFGIDRFYLGYIGLGIIKLITFGGFLFWWAIDLYLIVGNKIPDVKGLLPYKKKPTKEELEAGNFSEKEWNTAFLYSFLFGWVGIDRFYIGRKIYGIFKLLVTIITIAIHTYIVEYIIIFAITNGSQIIDGAINGNTNILLGSISDIIPRLAVLSGFGFLLSTLMFVLWLVDVILIGFNYLKDDKGKVLWKA